MEAIARDYSPKGVQFYYIYKDLAHPGWNNYLNPRDLEERLLHMKEAKRTLGTNTPWLCVDLQNEFTKYMGAAPNSEFIIDAEGRVVSRRGWNQPNLLREKLTQLVGKVENPTRPEDLDLPKPKPAALAASGILEPIELPDDAIELKVVANETENQESHYVKLRASASGPLLYAGEGDVFLTFELDPIYHAHWNNLRGPFRLEIEAVNQVELSVQKLEGPKMEADGDSDPREFKFSVSNINPGAKLVLKASYVVCNDDAGWCKPIQREFYVQNDPTEMPGVRIAEKYQGRMQDYLTYRDEGPPSAEVTATEEQVDAVSGVWKLSTDYGSQVVEWELHLFTLNDELIGWSTMDPARPKIDILSYDGSKLVFLNLSGPVPEKLEINIKDGNAEGTHLSIFGDLPIEGEKER